MTFHSACFVSKAHPVVARRRRSLRWQRALEAGVLYAVWPGNVYYRATLFTEPAFNALISAWLLLLIMAASRSGRARVPRADPGETRTVVAAHADIARILPPHWKPRCGGITRRPARAVPVCNWTGRRASASGAWATRWIEILARDGGCG